MRAWRKSGTGQAVAFCTRLWNDHRAVTAIEYAFMGSVIGAALVAAAVNLNSGLSAAFHTVANAFPTWSP